MQGTRRAAIPFLATGVALPVLLLPGEGRSQTSLQLDEPVQSGTTNTGSVGAVPVTIVSPTGAFTGGHVDDWDGVTRTDFFGALALPGEMVGDSGDLAYGDGDFDTVTITIDAPIKDPIFFIVDFDALDASLTVTGGGTTFTANAEGKWNGNVFTRVAMGPDGAFGAVEYAGGFSAGKQFQFTWNYLEANDSGELVNLFIGQQPVCGDVDGDELLGGSDLKRACEHLVGATGGGATDCGVADIAFLERILAGEEFSPMVCDASVP